MLIGLCVIWFIVFAICALDYLNLFYRIALCLYVCVYGSLFFFFFFEHFKRFSIAHNQLLPSRCWRSRCRRHTVATAPLFLFIIIIVFDTFDLFSLSLFSSCIFFVFFVSLLQHESQHKHWLFLENCSTPLYYITIMMMMIHYLFYFINK